VKLIVIHNPEAGTGDWSVDRVDRLLKDAGHEAQIVSADSDWLAVLDESADAFVAAGGDGTVHDVIHALAERAVPVAILPLGTANNVAHALGYRRHDDVASRVAQWRDNEQQLQVGLAEAGDTRIAFVETVGAGAFAKMRDASDGKKRSSDPSVSLLNIRKKLVKQVLDAQPAALKWRVDGREHAGSYVMAECLNLQFFGPRLHLAPNESGGDGLLTVCAVPADARDTLTEWIATGVGDPQPWLLDRGRVVELQTHEVTHVDGKIWPKKKARTGELRMRAGAWVVRVMV